MIKRFIAGSVGAIVGGVVAWVVTSVLLLAIVLIAVSMGFGWPADWGVSDRDASIMNEGIKGLLVGVTIAGAVYGARWAGRRVGGIAKKS